MQPPIHLTDLSGWKGGLGILEIDTQRNYKQIKWIRRLLSPTNSP